MRNYNNPLVSIIMNCYNGEKYLYESNSLLATISIIRHIMVLHRMFFTLKHINEAVVSGKKYLL